MLSKFLKRSTWTDIVISLVFVLFGVLLIAKPEQTRGAISIILGIVFIAIGVLKLVEYYTSETKEDFMLTTALVSVIIGVVILFASEAIIDLFRIILGIWIIVTGVMDLITVIEWKEMKSGLWVTSAILAVLMILAGIIILVTPNIETIFIGIMIVFYAVFDIVDRVIFMKKIENFEEKTSK